MRRLRTAAAALALLMVIPARSWGGPVDLTCSTLTRSDARCPNQVETGTDLPAEGARIVASADGARLYVIGEAGGRNDLAFAVYDARSSHRLLLRRVRLSGGIDPLLWSAALASDGAVVVSATYFSAAGSPIALLAKLSPDGRLDWSRANVLGCPSAHLDDFLIRGGIIYIAGACSEDGTGDDAVLRKLDLRSGQPLWTADTPRRDGVFQTYRALAVSADRIVAVGQMYDGSAYRGLIDIYRSGKRVSRVLTGDVNSADAFRFAATSPDGRLVAAYGRSYQNPLFYTLLAVLIDPMTGKAKWRRVVDPGPGGASPLVMRWAGHQLLLGSAVSRDTWPFFSMVEGDDQAIVQDVAPGVLALDDRTGATRWNFVESAPDLANGVVQDVVVTRDGILLVGDAGAVPNVGYGASAGGLRAYQRQGDADGYLREISLDGKPLWSSSHNVNGMRGYSYERLTAVATTGNRLFAAGVGQLPFVGGSTITYRENGVLLTYDEP